HQHYPSFDIIDMGGRMYDPLVGRFLAPDPFVQDWENSQNFNRYSYCLNNPLKYTDPSGEFFQYILGGIFGGIQGFSIGKSAGLSGWKLFGSTIIGAGIGAISGGIANSISSNSMIMSNTLSIMAGSHFTSTGMCILGSINGVNIPYNLNFGFGSLSFDEDGFNFGFLGKKGNSKSENWGYFLGAMANVSDFLMGSNPKLVDLVTNHTDKTHSALVNSQETAEMGFSDPNKLISFGPGANDNLIWCPGNSDWNTYTNSYEVDEVWRLSIRANLTTLKNYSTYLKEHTPHYSWLINSCVSQTSRALNLSGVYNIGIHPLLLHSEMFVRNMGLRPLLFSYYLTLKH
ncbi:MAG: hypothetical protein J6V76_03315, partial [Bacteroidales bacterium]|nr:hypothetical protein [Bacteroidales bacterium]